MCLNPLLPFVSFLPLSSAPTLLRILFPLIVLSIPLSPRLWVPRTNCAFLTRSWKRRAWWRWASQCRLWWTRTPPDTPSCHEQKTHGSTCCLDFTWCSNKPLWSFCILPSIEDAIIFKCDNADLDLFHNLKKELGGLRIQSQIYQYLSGCRWCINGYLYQF